MRPFRFLHAADLHLDSPFRGMMSLSAVIRERVMESTFLALSKLVKVAVKEKVDFIVMSGDIFDLSDRSLRAQIRFQEAMVQLEQQRIQVFVIHGNHDPEDGRRAALTWPANVHFYSSDDVEMKPAFDHSGQIVAHVYGMSYPTAAVTENLSKRYKIQNQDIYNIGLLHCNVDGDPAHESYAPCTKQDLIRSGMHYWALGHVHTRQILHTNPFIVYPGNIQGRSVRELGPKGCYVVDVSAEGISELSFHCIDTLRWYHDQLSIEHMNTEQELTDALHDRMEQIRERSEGVPSVVRITLEGRGILHRRLQNDMEKDELLALLREQQSKLAERNESIPFVWIENLKVRTGIEVDLDQLLEQESFLGDLLRISRKLIEEETGLEAFSEQALEPLMSNSLGRKYLKSIPLAEQKEWLQAAEELAIHLLFMDEEWEN